MIQYTHIYTITLAVLEALYGHLLSYILIIIQGYSYRMKSDAKSDHVRQLNSYTAQ